MHSHTPRVRPAAVAGLFYPDDKQRLIAMINALLRDSTLHANLPPAKALIVPHAGYIYSGATAATAYAQLRELRDQIKRVVIIGPAHRVAFNGIAATDDDYFRTPLGDCPVDTATIAKLTELPYVTIKSAAHAQEHSIEVQLPFLQTVLANFTIVPLVVGNATAEQIDHVLRLCTSPADTLIVISTDLSHFLNYDEAVKLDTITTRAIENLEPSSIGEDQACGRQGLKGLLKYAKSCGLVPITLDVRNSGDTAGTRDRVVGYGAYLLH